VIFGETSASNLSAVIIERFIMSLRLFTSNRLETLAKSLAEVVGKPLSSPLDNEVIIVMSKGMERWVSMELAGRLGIWANCSFPFPNSFVREIFRKVFPDIPERSAFDPGIMTWKIMKLLPDLITQKGFEALRGYLSDIDGDLKRFQLSERIADTFDQYMLFRPEMILGWEEENQKDWQAVLWRELVNTGGISSQTGSSRGLHPARILKDLMLKNCILKRGTAFLHPQVFLAGIFLK
jgi:exodeoxyribonuclease V gamma subunit